MGYKSMKFLSLGIGLLILGFEIFLYRQVSHPLHGIDLVMLQISICSTLECMMALMFCEKFKSCWETLWRLVWFFLYLGGGIVVISQSTEESTREACEHIQNYQYSNKYQYNIYETVCPFLQIRVTIGGLSIVNSLVYLLSIPKTPSSIHSTSWTLPVTATNNNTNHPAAIQNSLRLHGTQPTPAPAYTFLTNDLRRDVGYPPSYEAPPPYSALSVPLETHDSLKANNESNCITGQVQNHNNVQGTEQTSPV